MKKKFDKRGEASVEILGTSSPSRGLRRTRYPTIPMQKMFFTGGGGVDGKFPSLFATQQAVGVNINNIN